MVLLTDAEKLDVYKQMIDHVQKLAIPANLNTGVGHPVTATKPDLKALITHLDGRAEAEEVTSFTAIPAGDGKDYMQANQALFRHAHAFVYRKRAQVVP